MFFFDLKGMNREEQSSVAMNEGMEETEWSAFPDWTSLSSIKYLKPTLQAEVD